jgi:hypothetical protein
VLNYLPAPLLGLIASRLLDDAGTGSGNDPKPAPPPVG